MTVILALIATVLSIAIIILITGSDTNMAKALLLSLIRAQRYKISDIELKKEEYLFKMQAKGYNVKSKKVQKKFKELDKKIDECQKKITTLKKGKLSVIDLLPLIGYSLIGKMKIDANNSFYKKIHLMYLQLEEKSEAGNNTIFLMAQMISYAVVGTDIALLMLALATGTNMGSKGLVIGLVVFVISIILAYIPYNEVEGKTKERAESIEHDFASMVSKLTLLVSAGMEVSRAWELASAKGSGVLFVEMRKVTEELNNNISPVVAYGNFIDRCNSKYTTKLATSIIQNISKGNAEIVKLFREITDESWNEKKHNARRMGETAAGKLLVPTILLFAGILLLVLGPTLLTFSNTSIG
ncbi:MAG: type II secretion system F family protein [Oscillospiraceae bacterium]|nr:type II secretion system F family protein [Oscillospiraceae bacterium]